MTFDQWAALYPVAAAELRTVLTPETPVATGSSEARIQSETRLAAVKHGALWRNNAGATTDETGRQIRYGLGNESAKFWKSWRSGDLVGVTRMTIQPHHVGRTVGVFTMMEVKDADWKPSRLNQPSNERERAQMACLTHVVSLGGIAGFVTDATADYERYVAEFIS